MSEEKLFDDDARLARQAARGDKEAFEDLVLRYQGPIYSFALNFFRIPDVAEDITQETFLRAYRFLKSYDPSRRFVTWLYSIARNLCIDKHRERVRKEGIDIDEVNPLELTSDRPEADPLSLLVAKENRSVLAHAVEQLPEKYRTPIVLCYMQGLSYQEIGDVMGISLNNTKIRIFRAKKMLLELLGIEEDVS